MNKLLCNVHEGLDAPGLNTEYVKSDVVYYHYGCDGVDDRGWGCGYRTLQSICSWVIQEKVKLVTTQNQIASKNVQLKAKTVPSLREIQEALVSMGDKPQHFIGSRDWIGSFEICLCLDFFHEVPCKIVHVSSGTSLEDHLPDLLRHFQEFGSPIMMGGDTDNASKGILGVCMDVKALLVMDPHFYGNEPSTEQLQNDGFVTWRTLDSFVKDSFYNLCLPRIKYIPQA